MKNALLTILILLLVLPALITWAPHGTVHALHDHQGSHHQAEQNTHKVDHTAHDDHSTDLNIATYYSDYLHVDLHSQNKTLLKAPDFDTQDANFALQSEVNQPMHFNVAFVQSRAPPDWRQPRFNSTPIFLATQRQRI